MALVVVSGFGALNGWTMLAGEMPLAAADDGLFPQRFARLSGRGVPAFGIVTSTMLSSAAVLLSHGGATGITVFNTLVLMTGITGAVPYAFSALAQISGALPTAEPSPLDACCEMWASPSSACCSPCCSS